MMMEVEVEDDWTKTVAMMPNAHPAIGLPKIALLRKAVPAVGPPMILKALPMRPREIMKM